MEILFDGVTIMVLGKSGVYSSIHIHPFVFALVLFGLVGWWASRRNAEKEQLGERRVTGGDAVLLGLIAITLLALVLIPALRVVCDNPITCSWHPRADAPATWTVSTDRVVYDAFERALR